MTYIKNIIKRIFSNKVITHRILDLIHILSNDNTINSHVCISFENDNNSREFCYFTMDELIMLYRNIPVNQRYLYELILPTNKIKAYIDFEYYINNNPEIQNHSIGPSCCLKIIYNLLKCQQNIIHEGKNYLSDVLEQFLVLESSSSEKISYHFIDANPSILFENNITFGLFIKVFIHFMLYSIAEHRCSTFNINFNRQKYTTTELIFLLTPYVNILRTHCTKCALYCGSVCVADIAYLLVSNKLNQMSFAVDTNVYSKYQQFRLFDCVKKGQLNPLVQCSHFPFKNNIEVSYTDIIRKSIITNVEDINIPIIYIKNNQFFCTSMNLINSSEVIHKSHINLNKLNTHFNSFYSVGAKSRFNSYSDQSNIPLRIKEIENEQDQQVQQLIPFVEKLIKRDKTHEGYIRSSVRGTYNEDMIFFNIGGEYRYCDQKGTHHKRNTTAILINTKNLTYTHRCKDASCDNTSLLWKKID